MAVDFVSPESLPAALAHRQSLRDSDMALPQALGLPPEEREFQEKLQSQLMLLRGVLRAADVLAKQQPVAGAAARAARAAGADGDDDAAPQKAPPKRRRR